MMGRRIRYPCTAMMIAFLGTMSPARAAFDDTTLRVAARVLGFMDKPPSGDVAVAIVYAPGDSRSAADAARLEAMLGNGGLRAGNMNLRGRMVKIADVGTANVGLFLLTEGVGAQADRLRDVAQQKHIPCITTDLAQTKSGACAIGVLALPRVEIIVNKAAANASGVIFSTAFRMLITEF